MIDGWSSAAGELASRFLITPSLLEFVSRLSLSVSCRRTAHVSRRRRPRMLRRVVDDDRPLVLHIGLRDPADY